MRNIVKTFFLLIAVSLWGIPPATSYADWHGHNGGGGSHGGGHYYRHDRSFVGVNFSVWPSSYYYGSPYYPYYAPDDAVLVSPPVYQQPVEVIQPPTVIDTQAQASVPAPAPVVSAPAATDDAPESITINIPNDKGSYTAVTLKKSGNGFTGPQGEFYAEFPKVSQLKVIYGK